MMTNEQIDNIVLGIQNNINELTKIRGQQKDLYVPTKHGVDLINIFGNEKDKKGLEQDRARLGKLQAEEQEIRAKLESKKQLFNVSVIDLMRSLSSYISKDLKNDKDKSLIVEPIVENGVLKCKLGFGDAKNDRDYVLPVAVITNVKKHADKDSILMNGMVNMLDSGMIYSTDRANDDFSKVYVDAIRTTLTKSANSNMNNDMLSSILNEDERVR